MVKHNSPSRFSFIKSQVILTQTDTTVGFLSQDARKLQEIKSRPSTKPFIQVFSSFPAFSQTKRIPNKHKKFVRRAKKTTFIVKNKAFRIAPHPLHVTFLQKTAWFYSTSANESGKHFERSFCEAKADIIIENKDALYEGEASKLYKINNTKIKRLR
jgi:tRNA A37 threonylcarbamoyladenosine synthetase subunit TsaC/SUA5/YrdC